MHMRTIVSKHVLSQHHYDLYDNFVSNVSRPPCFARSGPHRYGEYHTHFCTVLAHIFTFLFHKVYSTCSRYLRAPRTSPRPALIILSSYLISQIISNIDCGDTWHNLACPMIATPRVPLWVRRSHSSLSTGSQACSSIKAQIFREVEPS